MLRIGIDLGGTKTEGIVIDRGGKVLVQERRATPSARGYDAVLAAIVELVRDLEARAGTTCLVGIGTPGAIAARTGFLMNSNTTCLNGKPVAQDLKRLLGRPVQLENDANCFALSEALDGAGQGRAVVFGVILGTGVGGGIVAHGRLLAGAHHIAGEWGHNVLEADGPPCYCGKRGCVETLLSGPGLVRDYAAHGGAAGAPGGEALDAHAVVARAYQGEPAAARALERYLDRFGRALAVVVNILDPDVVVLGGGLSNIQALYDKAPARVRQHVFAARGGTAAESAVHTDIVRNRHGDSSGVRGAAQLWDAA